MPYHNPYLHNGEERRAEIVHFLLRGFEVRVLRSEFFLLFFGTEDLEKAVNRRAHFGHPWEKDTHFVERHRDGKWNSFFLHTRTTSK